MNSKVSAVKPSGTPLGSAPSRPTQPHPPPQIPDLELLRCIGVGGYGEVWLARNVIGTYRAVKVLYRDRFKDERPYEREYSGIRKFEPISLSHDGLVDILQIGRNDRQGYFYYVMELADDASGEREKTSSGESGTGSASSAHFPTLPPAHLQVDTYTPKTIRAEISRLGRLPFEECLQLSLSLTAALGHLHKSGLVHRDIKPSNIIFVNGVPKLADIGLVADVGDAKSLVGTEGFIPLEGPGTPQADIYSLGKVLYEIATGKDRQSFPEPATLLEQFPDRKQLLELNEIILKACENDPRQRYRSAEEMHEELELLQVGKSVRRLRVMERRLAILTRSAWAAAAGALILGAGFLFAMHEKHQAVIEAQRADREAGRARRAEADSKEMLRMSYLAQAQAGRWSRRAGRRFEGVELLRKAAEIGPGLAVRNEAIACMALTDLKVINEWQASYTRDRPFAFDANYERYVFADDKGAVHLCLVRDATELIQFSGYEPPFHALVFSPDGKLLFLACGKDGDRVEILDLDRKEVMFRLSEPHFRTVDFSADSRLAAISYNREKDNWPVHIFDLVLNKRLASFSHPTLPYNVRFHPKQFNLLLSSDYSHDVRIWDWQKGKRVQSLIHPDWVVGIDWHPEGDTVVTGCADNKIRIWEVATGKERVALAGHEWVPFDVTFSADGNFLASRGWEGIVRLWDVQGKRELTSRPALGRIYPFSRATNQLGVVTDNGRLAILEAMGGHGYRLLRSRLSPDDRGNSCDFSPDGALLVSGHPSSMRLWDVRAGNEIAEILTATSDPFVVFHPEGSSLFVKGSQGVEEWLMGAHSPTNTTTLTLHRRFPANDPHGVIQLSRDGRTLAIGAQDALHVFDLASGRETRRITPGYTDVFAALSPDTEFAATWQRFPPFEIHVWDLARSNIVHVVHAHSSTFAAFSPNSQWLIIGDEVEYRAWDFRTWQSLWAIPREAAGFWAKMAFSHDSRMLALAISRSTVRLVEAATGRELATLEAPERMDIHWINFNPDGTQLAVVTGSGPIQLWDLRLIRQQLASMNLDWEMPLYPSHPSEEHLTPLSVTVRGATDEHDAELSRRYLDRAWTFACRGQYESAVAAYEKAIELNPESASAYNLLAWAYVTWPARFRSPEKALPLALKAVELSRTNHAEMNTLGVVYYRLGRLTNAIETLEAGFKTHNEPGHAGDFFFLGMAYQRLGEAARAHEYLARATIWLATQSAHSPTGMVELNAFGIEAEDLSGR